MTWIGLVRRRWLRDRIDRRRHDYAEVDDSRRAQIQLTLLNAEWRRILEEVPHYKRLHEQRRVPARFESLDEFRTSVPPTTRATIQEQGPQMTCTSRPPEWWRMTGGSTASPIQLPAWKNERLQTAQDLWWARSWYGIDPGSRLFLIWGHSHLMGTGAAGWINTRVRQTNDRLLGYRRFSAYDLQPTLMRRAGAELLCHRPEYVLGYSVALHLFAQENRDRADAFRALRLKAVVGTAEGFPSPDSVALLGDVLGCPVAMEYGAVEAGLIAHTRPEGGYRVMWRSVLCEVDPACPGSSLRVTTLYPRSFPLVRYEIGDEVELVGGGPSATVAIAEFGRVLGRCNDYVQLGDGARIHSEVFTHALRACPTVRKFQVAQHRRGIRIDYTAAVALEGPECEAVRGRLERAHPGLSAVELRHVENIAQTPAGKTRMVVVDPAD